MTRFGLAKIALLCWGLTTVGCAGAAGGALETPPAVRQGTPSTGAATSGAPLPPGVLARRQGIQGVIQVEERDGLRLLSIDGEVQGAVRIDEPMTIAGDPLVALTRKLRPDAGSALVIGLGTGRTAAELSADGMDVEVAELEPAVIDIARTFFSYTGHASSADGLAYAAGTGRRFDLILVDAGAWPPPHLIDDAARALLRDRLAGPAGLIAFRLRATTDDPRVRELFHGLPHMFRALFGSGSDREEQNLYLLWSAAPLTLVEPVEIAAWPVHLPGETVVAPPQPDGQTAVLTGYLVRDAATGALVLDLPHFEMGALRYLLGGPASAELDRELPRTASFPTAGDIRSDGDTAPTLKTIAGGGGCKRSDVRFSPVLAAVKGTVAFRAVQDPDAAFFWRREHEGEPAVPLLPYGGALYDLEVSEVLWTLDRKAFDRLRKQRLAGPARLARQAIARGDLPAAAAALERYEGAFDFLGEAGKQLLLRQVSGAVAEALAEPAATPAQGCAHALEAAAIGQESLDDRQWRELVSELRRCAAQLAD